MLSACSLQCQEMLRLDPDLPPSHAVLLLRAHAEHMEKGRARRATLMQSSSSTANRREAQGSERNTAETGAGLGFGSGSAPGAAHRGEQQARGSSTAADPLDAAAGAVARKMDVVRKAAGRELMTCVAWRDFVKVRPVCSHSIWQYAPHRALSRSGILAARR